MIYSEKKTLYIIRHGETEFNRLNIVQGSGVDTSLNETGNSQADKFYLAYRHIPFDKIYTSALKRTHQSVIKFIQAGLPHESLHQLNEISWGEFEGKQQTPEQRALYFDVVQKWNAGDKHARIPGGESPAELQKRQKEALDHILRHKPESNILICMHGRAMKSFLCLLTQNPIDKMEEFPHTNLGLYKLEYDGDGFTLICSNDINHLA